MRFTRALFCLLSIVAFCTIAIGQSVTPETSKKDSLEDLLRKNTFKFRIRDGRLSGAGEKFLTESMTNIQFVALGEVHNRRAIHQFGEALFSLLHEEFEFNYLALEEDPYWGKLLSRSAREGGAEEVIKLGLRYPNAFHLYTEDEMKMIGNIGKLSSALKNPIWGLNQVFGATHIYVRLIKMAPNDRAKTVVKKLLDHSLEYEKERFQKNVQYVGEIAKREDFELLREAFKPSPKSEADWLINQIELSNRIYAPYYAKPSPPSTAFFESGKMRETNMKHLFAERYREAQANGAVLPKVLAMPWTHTSLSRPF